MIEFGVTYLAICEKSYPKKLAFVYLEEIQREFHSLYGQEMGTVARPYAFVKFDSFIQRVKKQYQDPRNQRNLHKLNEDLGVLLTDNRMLLYIFASNLIQRIMNKNIQDVLGRGEMLNDLQQKSQGLKDSSAKCII